MIVRAARHPLVWLYAWFLVIPLLMTAVKSTLSLGTEIVVFTLLAIAYNLLMGYTGLVSFGHSAFFGLGGYAAGLVQLHLVKGFVVPLLAGVVFATLAGFQPPADRILDGVDQSHLLLGKSDSGARSVYHYFCQNELQAVRKGPWKLHLSDRKVFYSYVKDRGSGGLELYNLDTDIGETKNVAKEHPEVVSDLLKLAKSFEWPEKLFDNSIGLPKPKKAKPSRAA